MLVRHREWELLRDLIVVVLLGRRRRPIHLVLLEPVILCWRRDPMAIHLDLLLVALVLVEAIATSTRVLVALQVVLIVAPIASLLERALTGRPATV